VLAGESPYQAVLPLGEYPFNTPFYYPFPAALAALPFSWIHLTLAGALFFGLGAGLLAYALLREEGFRLPLFFSTPFLVAAAVAQWSPLVMAAGLLLPLAWLLACKPNIGIPLFLSRPSKLGGIAMLLFFLISLAVRPLWPVEWLRVVNAPSFHQAPVWVNPAGWLLLLAILRYSTRAGRLLLLLALMPQSLWFYDQLMLWLIPRSRGESWLLTLASWLAYGLWRLQVGWDAPVNAARNPGLIILFFLYFPALAMVLLPDDFLFRAYNRGKRLLKIKEESR
jgi:hypothetical protein